MNAKAVALIEIEPEETALRGTAIRALRLLPAQSALMFTILLYRSHALLRGSR